MVYHAAVGDRLLADHVNYTNKKPTFNIFKLNDTADTNYSLLEEIIRISREGDWILQVNSAEG